MLQSRCQRKVDGTVSRVSLQTHFFLINEISESTWNEELQEAVLGENSDQINLHLTEFDLEIQNLERRNSEYALIESRRELESQRRQFCWKPMNGQIKLKEREHICVVNWR